MTTARAYRGAHPQWYAVAELQRHAGTEFDPVSVDALLAALPRVPTTLDAGSSERSLLQRGA
jgi:HD-GYP domain-containing protein (c-di-GMP phosphodiesterase class II)